jgi:sterol desaturase/sphingolipid hydroxylase (fatty acid hydroxylase superfamily)
MEAFILQHEPAIRLAFFLGIFGAVAIGEVILPRRKLTQSKKDRWFANVGIVVIDALVLRLLFPAAAVGSALLASERGWGFFNNANVPYWIAVAVSVVFLDFVIYLQHVMFHAVPAFWRLHMMHHADLDFDLTTGTRFHPIEIVLSMIIKISMVTLIGAPPLAVIIFEVILNGTAMFNHSNISVPLGLDKLLRLFVVTPDMHRVHHSVFPTETNSNYGFNLPWWDRLMGTYKPQPRLGHVDMTIGLNQFRDPSRLTLFGILLLPFTGKPGNYPINSRGGSGE